MEALWQRNPNVTASPGVLHSSPPLSAPTPSSASCQPSSSAVNTGSAAALRVEAARSYPLVTASSKPTIAGAPPAPQVTTSTGGQLPRGPPGGMVPPLSGPPRATPNIIGSSETHLHHRGPALNAYGGPQFHMYGQGPQFLAHHETPTFIAQGNSQITISAWKSMEIPHKLELKHVWIHVEGVPHIVRHFCGLWAVGCLMDKTLDVDLINLRRRGLVRILVAMTNNQILSKEKDNVEPFISTDVVVKLKGYDFTFRREPTYYIPDSNFLPFMWRRIDDGADDDSTGKEKDDVMDTSDHTTPLSNRPSSSSAPDVHMQQVQQRGVRHIDSVSTKYTCLVVLAVTQFNSNP
ncbi:hypothetical protein ZWY2020_011040 [Hordeum vulgare]|nr:hypothetical protein ZWY2020_011040 [Hordeum vulgare]